MATNEYDIAKIAKDCKNDSPDYYNTLNLVKVPPIIIDSHMHIMSGHCTPLPLLWQNIAGLELSSGTIDFLGTVLGVSDIVLKYIPIFSKLRSLLGLPGQIGLIGKKGTVEIGDEVVQDNEKTYQHEEFKETYHDKDLFSAMSVMPMDMEYAHYAGFSGYKIYYMVKHRWYNYIQSYDEQSLDIIDYYPPLPDEIIGDKPLPGPIQKIFKEMRDKKEKMVGGNVTKHKDDRKTYFVLGLKKEGDSNQISREIIWLDPNELQVFTVWEDQEIDIRHSAVKHPWQLMPMYHFEPRRWLSKCKNYQNYIASVNRSGIYMGFKMYPSLGYNPADLIQALPEFYEFCDANKLPIISHCSPSGMPTHERPLYLQMDHPDHDFKKEGFLFFKKHTRGNQPKHLQSLFDKYDDDRYKQSWEEFYFSESYVAPKNWKPVISTYPNLRLCLAHFGGDDQGFSRWGDDNSKARKGKYDQDTLWDQQIIDMVKGYKNCFVDISYFMVEKNYDMFTKLIREDDEIKDGKEKIKNKILFGTDWYLIEKDRINYKAYCTETKKQLDRFDETLWIRCSCLNPMRFFGLDNEKIIDNLSEGLKKGIDEYSEQKLLSRSESKLSLNNIDTRKKLLKDYLKEVEGYKKVIGYPRDSK